MGLKIHYKEEEEEEEEEWNIIQMKRRLRKEKRGAKRLKRQPNWILSSHKTVMEVGAPPVCMHVSNKELGVPSCQHALSAFLKNNFSL